MFFTTLAILGSINVWASSVPVKPEPEPLIIEHLANAGVKITSGDKVTLIDALFGPHNRFSFLNEQEFKQLSKKGASLALTTHAHSDHFHPKQTTAFLQDNEQALFFATPQAIKHLGKITETAKILSPELTGYQSYQFTHDGIKVSVLNFPHMAPQAKTQNYAYLVEVDGWKVLHVGDADINTEVIAAHKLAHQDIDLLLIHDLFPVVKRNYRELITQMKVGKIAFVHIMDKQIEPLSRWVTQHLPEAKLLTKGHEKIVLRK